MLSVAAPVLRLWLCACMIMFGLQSRHLQFSGWVWTPTKRTRRYQILVVVSTSEQPMPWLFSVDLWTSKVYVFPSSMRQRLSTSKVQNCLLFYIVYLPAFAARTFFVRGRDGCDCVLLVLLFTTTALLVQRLVTQSVVYTVQTTGPY